MMHLKKVLRTALVAAALGAVLPAGASAATGSLGGTVTEATGNTAVPQFAVELYGPTQAKLASTCTDGTGKYAFSGLESGSYYVRFSGDPSCAASGFAPVWSANRLRAVFADPVAVVDGADSPGVDASLQPEATVGGRVTGADGVTGLPNVAVRIIDTDGGEAGRACTAPDGTYTVRRLTPLPYIAQFAADGSCGPVDGYATRYYRVAEPSGSATAAGASGINAGYGQALGGIDVRLAVHRTLTVTVGGTGTGVVRSADDRIACPGACTDDRPDGTVVTLTPTPQGGSTFTGWTGACTGIGACTVTLNGDRTVGATFAAPTGGEDPPGGGETPGGGTTGGGTTGGGTTVIPETPSGPAPSVTPPTGSGAVAAKPKCTVASPAKVRRGRFTVKVSCDRRATIAVGGTVRFKRGRKTTTVKLATRTTTATKATVSLALPVKAARARKARVRLSASLTVRATTSAGGTSVARRAAPLR